MRVRRRGRLAGRMVRAHLGAMLHHLLVGHAAMLGRIVLGRIMTALRLMLLHHLAVSHHLFMAHVSMLHAMPHAVSRGAPAQGCG